MKSIAISSLTKAMLKTGQVLVHSGVWAYVWADGTCNGYQGKPVRAKLCVVRAEDGQYSVYYKCKDTGTVGSKRVFNTLGEIKESFKQ